MTELEKYLFVEKIVEEDIKMETGDTPQRILKYLDKKKMIKDRKEEMEDCDFE